MKRTIFDKKAEKRMKEEMMISCTTKSSFGGSADETARFLTEDALLDRELWRKFVQAFRDREDGKNLGWRGEYWGKMMRGAAMLYAVTRDETLYDVITETVCDMLTVADSDGRVSSYTRETELDGWDMWCRKYVMLGLEYYYDVCQSDALKARIVDFLCGCADAILDRVGPEEGKLPVHRTGKSWGGLNSCSVLEPFVRLYRLKNKPAYLAFAEHIIEMGGSTLANIFELAYKNELYPYQYGVSKAYEMISCFEGLLEYYLLTGIEKYKIAIVNFGKALIASDVSVIGSLGATHELLDHTKNRQTAYTDTVRQETCVTVTWMKFCARLLRLTGDPIFADQLELAYFNAYRGSLNTEHRTYEKYLANKCFERLGLDRYVDTFLPFDSYAPLTPGQRGRAIGGHQMLPDLSYYGCCACIGVAGIGSYMESFALSDREGIVINLYEAGEMTCQCGNRTVHVTMKTDYPKTGSIHLTVQKEDDEPLLCKIRIPEWSKEAYLINLPNTLCDGYATLTLTERSTSFTLVLDMRMRMIKPEVWDRDLVYTDRSLTTKEAYLAGPMQVEHRPEDDAFVCLMRGPITLAADSRLGKDADSVFKLALDGGEPVWRLSNEPSCLPDTKEIVHCIFEDAEGGEFSLVDYGAAGRDWRTKITAWLPTEQ